MSNTETEFYRTIDGAIRVCVHHRIQATPEAAFAMQIMDRLALVAAHPDGEDSAGRQKLRLLTPEEAAERACKMAAIAFENFKALGWLVEVPSLEEGEKLVTEEAMKREQESVERRERRIADIKKRTEDQKQ